jgi:hypothetical protein
MDATNPHIKRNKFFAFFSFSFVERKGKNQNNNKTLQRPLPKSQARHRFCFQMEGSSVFK